MSRALKAAALLCAAISLAACSLRSGSDAPALELGDAEDYAAFLKARGEAEKPTPFKPEPLTVSAVGKVQAQPDIAVITATITAGDKNESRAVNEMGKIINQVQTALAGRNIETGFTAIDSNREFDERCQNDNRFAQQRHREINNDYYFNKRLDDRGDTETKRRDPKPRAAQKICFAQEIKVSTNMVIRIQPANAAGDVLQALSEAGAENSRLFGYDFTDYDALYQEAAAKAVKLARAKAETVARVAGGTLGEIESFSVSSPERTGRFGPQPNVIRPANRYQGPQGSAIDRRIQEENRTRDLRNQNLKRLKGKQRYAQPAFAPAPIAEFDEVVVTASKQTIDAQDVRAPQQWDGFLANSKYGGTNGGPRQLGGNTNALSISLLSGPQTVSVTANLGYSYETPLNGKIIVEPEDDN